MICPPFVRPTSAGLIAILTLPCALFAQEPPPVQRVVFHVRLVQASGESQDLFATKRAPRRSGGEKPEGTADFRQTDAIRVHILEETADADALLTSELTDGTTEKLHDRNYRLFTTLGRDALLLLGDRFPVPTIAAPEAERPNDAPALAGEALDGPALVSFPPLPASPPAPRIEEFGARLAFLPVLLPDGKIRVRVKCRVRAPDFGNSKLIGGDYVPAIATRIGHTFLDVKPGQSFALTGLLNGEIVQKLSRLPNPDRSPLFKRVLEAEQTGEDRALVVIVTPEILSE